MLTMDEPKTYRAGAFSASLMLHVVAILVLVPVVSGEFRTVHYGAIVDEFVTMPKLTIEHRQRLPVRAAQSGSVAVRHPAVVSVARAPRAESSYQPPVHLPHRVSAPRGHAMSAGMPARSRALRSARRDDGGADRSDVAGQHTTLAVSGTSGGGHLGGSVTPVRPAQPAALPVAVPEPAPTPAPTPSPTPPPKLALAAGAGGWAQNYPARFMETSLVPALQALLGVHQHLRISVGEDGHATQVVFVTRVADPELRAEVERRLLQTPYLPAECSGMPCNGTVDVRT